MECGLQQLTLLLEKTMMISRLFKNIGLNGSWRNGKTNNFDADNGGRLEHIAFMVKTLERMGVLAVIIEDKI